MSSYSLYLAVAPITAVDREACLARLPAHFFFGGGGGREGGGVKLLILMSVEEKA